MAKRGQPDIQRRREGSAIERHNDMLDAAELRSRDSGTQRRMAAPANQYVMLVEQVLAAKAGVRSDIRTRAQQNVYL
ncbi:MAG: hypothetical protein RR983_12830 [Massilia sp.]